MPWLGAVAVGKATLSAAVFAYRPNWRFVVSAAGIGLLSLAFLPGWPAEYFAEIAGRTRGNYRVPLLVGPGILLPLALLRWRRPEARLIAVMSCVPQTMLFYDQLALGLVAGSLRQAMIFAACSYLPFFVIPLMAPRGTLAVLSDITSVLIVWMYYLPCLIVVLARPNTGPVPVWVERAAERLPAALRGRAGTVADPASGKGSVQ